MMPFYYVSLKEMPMTNSGKADKSKLPSPHQVSTESIRPPQTNEERAMAGIWSEVLGIEKGSIGADCSFFDLGGHSLLLTRLSAEIFYRYGVRIPIEELFSDPTVEKLAIYLKEPATDKMAEKGYEEQDKYNADATLSQKIMFIGNKLNPSEAFPNSGISYELIGDIDLSRLELALTKVIQANEGLRMTFFMENGKVLHKICPDFQFEIQRIKSFRKEIDEEIIALTRPFNFSKCPLLRAFYIESPGDRKFLYIDMPHINSDGISLEVMIAEMAAHYNGEQEVPSKMQFSDYQKYYRAYFNSDQYMADRLYWTEHFDTSIPVIHFKNNDNTDITGFSGVSRVINFPAGLSARLNKYLRTRNFTKFQLLLASYFLFLRRITTEEDISVMIPLHNRSIKGFENIIGLLANRSVVRMKVRQDKSINSFISECKATVLQAVHHTAYPFELIFDEQGKGKRYRKPLYQTFFNYHNHRHECRLGDAVLKLHIHNKAKEILPLSIDVFDMGDDHILRILSASGFFSKPELDKLVADFFDLLENIVENDEVGIQSLFVATEMVQNSLSGVSEQT
jgi:acyl carrier protein